MAGGAEDGLDGLGVAAAGLHVGPQRRGRLVGRVGRPVGTRLAHRLVGVGGAEDPRGP
jgi:hypothetical protein